MPQVPQPAVKATAIPQQRPPKPPYTGLFQEPALPTRSADWDEDDLPDAEAQPIITA